jgi:hypothetical protein
MRPKALSIAYCRQDAHVEPISGTTIFTGMIGAAFKQLPKLAQGVRLTPEVRKTAYERFTVSVWSTASSLDSVRMIEPYARPMINYYHKMFQRLVETLMAAQANFLGAFGALRLVAPAVVVGAAERVATCVSELAEVGVGDGPMWDKRQEILGSAMLDFTLLCRIDLGVATHPSAPVTHWYNPVSWVRSAKWWWSCSRRGDWPALPEAAHATKSSEPSAVETSVNDQSR